MEISYEEGKKVAWKGFGLLLAVTVAEVLFALLGNGHLISGLTFPTAVMIPVMVGMSLYKAYFIVREFMHLGHETSGMAASVILPTLLLLWAIIAFLWEGDAWGAKREYVKEKNQEEAVDAKDVQGTLMPAEELDGKVRLQ